LVFYREFKLHCQVFRIALLPKLALSGFLVPYSSISVKKNKKFGWGTWVAGFPRWKIYEKKNFIIPGFLNFNFMILTATKILLTE